MIIGCLAVVFWYETVLPKISSPWLAEDGLGLKDKGGPQRSWEPTDEPEPAAEESLGVPEGGARDFLGFTYGSTAGARGLPVDTPVFTRWVDMGFTEALG